VLKRWRGPVPPHALMVFPFPQKITTPFILDFSFKLLDEISNRLVYSNMKTVRDKIGCYLNHEFLEPPVYRRQVLVENLFNNLQYSQTISVDVGAQNCICANIPIEFKVVDVTTGGECHVQSNSPLVLHHVLNHTKFKAFSKATKQEIIDVAKRGPKFRSNPFNTLQEVHDQLDNNVQSYLHRLLYTHDIESSDWRAQMAEGVADEIIRKLNNQTPTSQKQFFVRAFLCLK
jgi:hypothetical protein